MLVQGNVKHKPSGRYRLHPSADWVRDFVLNLGAAPGPVGPNGKILVALPTFPLTRRQPAQ